MAGDVIVGEVGEGGGRGVQDLLVGCGGDYEAGVDGEVFGEVGGYAVEEVGGCAGGGKGEGDCSCGGDAWEGLDEDVRGSHNPGAAVAWKGLWL